MIQEDDEHRKTIEITVHNEDNGDVVVVDGHPNTLVSELIAQMYAKFHLAHGDGDRLRCESTGDDVFAHAEEHLQRYVTKHCNDLVWLFVGEQGGA